MYVYIYIVKKSCAGSSGCIIGSTSHQFACQNCCFCSKFVCCIDMLIFVGWWRPDFVGARCIDISTKSPSFVSHKAA